MIVGHHLFKKYDADGSECAGGLIDFYRFFGKIFIGMIFGLILEYHLILFLFGSTRVFHEAGTRLKTHSIRPPAQKSAAMETRIGGREGQLL